MSLLIKGLKMPQSGRITLQVGSDGAVYIVDKYKLISEKYDESIVINEIPPHGRLIDADAIDYRNDAMHDGTGHLVVADNFINGVLWINDCIDRTKAIIEEEK